MDDGDDAGKVIDHAAQPSGGSGPSPRGCPRPSGSMSPGPLPGDHRPLPRSDREDVLNDGVAHGVIFSTIARYRRAARRIVERPGPLAGPHGKAVAIVRLAEALGRERDPAIREWSREAVWREVRDLVGWEPPLVEEPRLPHAERVRLFVREGYRDCPVCGEPLKPGAWRGPTS